MPPKKLQLAAPPELRYEIRTVYHVDYNDFDKFIHEVYGNKGYEFAADQESSNDHSHEFRVDDKPVDSYEKAKLEKFSNGEHCSWVTRALLQDCCHRKLIPAGRYVIRVSW